MIIPIYLLIGLLYWALNSFVRKLEIDEDWTLPIIWFLAWPLAALSWLVILVIYTVEYLKHKLSKNQI